MCKAFLPLVRGFGPSAVYWNVFPATLIVSTQAFKRVGTFKFHIGLAITTLSADKN